ncbi:MAG: MurR/RpiR family transcriptional regulator [Nakamurella sp.]
MIDDNTDRVSDLIHLHMDQLTCSARKVARTLLADYPAAGLGTSHDLASAANVSAPTVVRMAIQLGFKGYTDMQTRLRTEVSRQGSSPVLRTIARGTGHSTTTEAGRAMRWRAKIIEATMDAVPAPEMNAAIDIVIRRSGRLLVCGGFFSDAIARILATQLSQLRPNVIYVSEPLSRDSGLILDAKRNSALIIFDLRRYEANALALARNAKCAGLDIILITDRWMSPVADVADVVLTAEVEAVPFDSFVGVLALAEVLVETATAKLGALGVRRMKEWEQHAIVHTPPFATSTEGLSR